MSVCRLESVETTIQNDAVQLAHAQKVLSDVYNLLELYGPVWYDPRLRERIVSALSH